MVRVGLCPGCIRGILEARAPWSRLCPSCRAHLQRALEGRPGRGPIASYARFWFTPQIWLLKLFGALDRDA